MTPNTVGVANFGTVDATPGLTILTKKSNAKMNVLILKVLWYVFCGKILDPVLVLY